MSMKRIISEELFNKVIAHLLKDENVQIFQQLIMAEKLEEKTEVEKENKGAE